MSRPDPPRGWRGRGFFGEAASIWSGDHPSVNGEVGICRCGGAVVWDQPDGVTVHRPDLHRPGCVRGPAGGRR